MYGFEPRHQSKCLASDKDTASQALTTEGREDTVPPNHPQFHSLALFHSLLTSSVQKPVERGGGGTRDANEV